MDHSLSILIPAAGDSSRLGQAKQLVKYDGVPLLQHTINTALSISPTEVIVVTGAHSKDIQDAIIGGRIKWVLNPDWQEGMGGSIAAGAKLVKPESEGLLVFLCDQWRIQTQDLLRLIQAWQSEPDSIVTAEWQGQTMPPVIFPSAFFEQLQTLSGNKGAQDLLKAQSRRDRTVSMKNAAYDLDSPAQLKGLNKKTAG